MKTENIPNASLLEIIFDGRNKEYGAYELRKKYNRRLTMALASSALLTLLVFFSSFIFRDKPTSKSSLIVCDIVDLKKVALPEEPIIIPPEIARPKPIATIKFTIPLIVEEDAEPEDLVPEMKEITGLKIGIVSQEGDKLDVIAPPVDNYGGVVETPKQDEEDLTRVIVQIEAEFPGGNAAWTKYVSREVNKNIDELQDEGRSGTVVVLFIVDKEGAVSEVRALPCGEAGVSNCLGSGTKLAEIAVNAIRKGPRWKSAIQNGRPVKAYRRQPVTFQLAEE